MATAKVSDVSQPVVAQSVVKKRELSSHEHEQLGILMKNLHKAVKQDGAEGPDESTTNAVKNAVNKLNKDMGELKKLMSECFGGGSAAEFKILAELMKGNEDQIAQTKQVSTDKETIGQLEGLLEKRNG